MVLQDLPQDIIRLLNEYQAPNRLHKHLSIVHHVGYKLIQFLEAEFPTFQFNKSLVLFGTATHDIGKCIVKEELYSVGKLHEAKGEQLLLNHGYTPEKARFAKTHGDWSNSENTIEDLLVCLSDKIWKGKRIPELEEQIRKEIITQLKLDYWDVYFELDAFIDEISLKSSTYLEYQRE